MCFLKKILTVYATFGDMTSNPTIHGDTTMADVKNAIDKTEELARKIWLAGLGAYGQGFNNIQGGYDKMSDKTRHFFDGLVEQGTKIEAEAKSTIGKVEAEAKSTIDKAGEKIKAQGEKLKEQGKTIRKEGVNLNVSARVEEIREKVSSKISMPSFSTSNNDEKLEELNAKLESLIEEVSKLSAAPKAPVAEKAETPAPKKKAPVRKPAPKKEQDAA